MLKSAVTVLQFELRSRWDEPEYGLSPACAEPDRVEPEGVNSVALSLPDDPGGLDHSHALLLSLFSFSKELFLTEWTLARPLPNEKILGF